MRWKTSDRFRHRTFQHIRIHNLEIAHIFFCFEHIFWLCSHKRLRTVRRLKIPHSVTEQLFGEKTVHLWTLTTHIVAHLHTKLRIAPPKWQLKCFNYSATETVAIGNRQLTNVSRLKSADRFKLIRIITQKREHGQCATKTYTRGLECFQRIVVCDCILAIFTLVFKKKQHFPFQLGIATNCRSNIKSNNNKTPRSVHSQREHKAARSSELHIIHNINA